MILNNTALHCTGKLSLSLCKALYFEVVEGIYIFLHYVFKLFWHGPSACDMFSVDIQKIVEEGMCFIIMYLYHTCVCIYACILFFYFLYVYMYVCVSMSASMHTSSNIYIAMIFNQSNKIFLYHSR